MISLLWFSILISFMSLFLGMLSQTWIHMLSKKFKFLAIPGERSSHTYPVPNIGGISFYLVFLLVYFLFGILSEEPELNTNILISILIFLVLGLLDDRGVLSARHKFLIQILAIFIFLRGSDIRINDLFGILYLENEATFYFTLFFILAYTNAYNLIDGIDGLAASLGILIFIISGITLFNFQDHFFYVMAFSFSGVLIGYLRYNFSKREKVLMGDTGSMLLGFISSIIILRIFNMLMDNGSATFPFLNPFAIFGLVAFPLYDMTRVFLIRLINGTSPFKADRLHLHHVIIDRFLLTHKKATGIIVFTNLIIILITALLSAWLSSQAYLIYYLILFVIFVLAVYFINRKIPLRTRSTD